MFRNVRTTRLLRSVRRIHTITRIGPDVGLRIGNAHSRASTSIAAVREFRAARTPTSNPRERKEFCFFVERSVAPGLVRHQLGEGEGPASEGVQLEAGAGGGAVGRLDDARQHHLAVLVDVERRALVLQRKRRVHSGAPAGDALRKVRLSLGRGRRLRRREGGGGGRGSSETAVLNTRYQMYYYIWYYYMYNFMR